jgi:hypothetical protein
MLNGCLRLSHPTDIRTLQNCRFHCFYIPADRFSDLSDYDPIEDEELGGGPTYLDDMMEAEYVEDFALGQALAETSDHGDDFREPSDESYSAVELHKAWDIFNNNRIVSKCNDCESLLPDPTADKCSCDMWSHFVGKRWLCIPCLLVEETQAYDEIQWKAGADGRLVRSNLTKHSRVYTNFGLATLVHVRKGHQRWRDSVLQGLRKTPLLNHVCVPSCHTANETIHAQALEHGIALMVFEIHGQVLIRLDEAMVIEQGIKSRKVGNQRAWTASRSVQDRLWVASQS